MPQFDTFIFSSVLFYFILGFLIFLYINTNSFLPFLGAILKLRYKLEHQTKVEGSTKLVESVSLPSIPLIRKHK